MIADVIPFPNPCAPRASDPLPASDRMPPNVLILPVIRIEHINDNPVEPTDGDGEGRA